MMPRLTEYLHLVPELSYMSCYIISLPVFTPYDPHNKCMYIHVVITLLPCYR
jgi:hypothetical protein